MEICAFDAENIGGARKVVEVNESAFRKRKENTGKQVNGTWVYGEFERRLNNCF